MKPHFIAVCNKNSASGATQLPQKKKSAAQQAAVSHPIEAGQFFCFRCQSLNDKIKMYKRPYTEVKLALAELNTVAAGVSHSPLQLHP